MINLLPDLNLHLYQKFIIALGALIAFVLLMWMCWFIAKLFTPKGLYEFCNKPYTKKSVDEYIKIRGL